METTKINVEARIKAGREKVWDYYTRPEHITNWNFAIPEWHCPSASNDMRVGGTYKARMEAKDGSFGFDFEAVYKSIEPGKHFTYSLGDTREVNVNMSEEGNDTLVSVTFDAENQNPIEMQKGGWQSILNNFKSYCETH
jgi:uncharacterized protein YndB with AHSA1/START domain